MGADYLLTHQFALDTEMAYKRNDGHATIGGFEVDDWNASSFGFLFGAKLFFLVLTIGWSPMKNAFCTGFPG